MLMPRVLTPRYVQGKVLRGAILLSCPQPPFTDIDLDAKIMRQFCVVPVLVVVIGDRAPWKCGTVAGVLMPFCGRDLEIPARPGVGEGLLVTVRQPAEGARGVRWLGECVVVHEYIKYWGAVMWQREGEEKGEEAKLMLIDLGTVSPEYEGDAKALGRCFCGGRRMQRG